MSNQDFITILLVALLILVLPSVGLFGMFRKAGVAGWKGLIPVYNTFVMLDIAKRPKYWFFLQFIPVVGWFISLGILIEFVKVYGKFKFYQHALTVVAGIFYLPYIGFNKKDKFIGPEAARKYKKSSTREWIDAGVFAVVAATLIRTFVFEAYTIPTSSMEKTLLVNDFLFVSKLSYGPRIPNTPIAMPFVHHTMPITGTKSYVEWIKIPYTRWFASPVKRNDVVVFNFPAGDTLTKEYDSKFPYYDLVRAYGRSYVWDNYTVTTRPVDKRENYIKRCTAIAGDTLELKEGLLYVNHQPAWVSPTSATFYNVTTNNKILDEESLRDAGIKLDQEDETPDFQPQPGGGYKINLTLGELDLLKKIPGVATATREIISNEGGVYPYDSTLFKWSADNFGPLWVPSKGSTVQLTPANIALYERVIKVYENNDWEQKDGKVFINGKEAGSYTFKMNYYWMMGDNRHKSQDSRYWGFVPEDHVVGEAWLIWMSWEHGIRWSRLFKRIH